MGISAPFDFIDRARLAAFPASCRQRSRLLMKFGHILNLLVPDFDAKNAVACPEFRPKAVIVEAAAGYVVGARSKSFRGVKGHPIFGPQR